MHILVTGASGFVGCHLTSDLVTAGHEVRAFVRSPEKLRRALEPFGVEAGDIHTGDVTDPAAVADAISGCDAVIHTANVYTLDPRQAKIMMKTNVDGTRVVLDTAVNAGCDPIVHVSTAQISWPRQDDDLDLPPLAPPQGMPYSDSKKRAESIARAWQDRGAPVVTTYPGGVFGPHDPGPGEQIPILRTALVPTAPFRIDGGFPLCDIDWVTRIHLDLMEPGRGPHRVTCSGRYVTFDEWFQLARDLTGRSLPNSLPTPDWLLRASTRTMNAVQRVIPGRMPVSRESGWILTNSYGYPDEEATRIAGEAPPVAETVERAIRWAVEAGHISAKQAGDVATSRAERGERFWSPN